MVIDCHVHVAACTPGHGCMSQTLLNSLAFRFMRWRFGLWGTDESREQAMEAQLAGMVEKTPELDAVVVLALDAVYDANGQLDASRTHLWVSNDYVIELTRRHPSMLFGCSVHPFRRDALQELERCIRAGAVLMKWLPVTQDFSPSDPRCIPLYEAMLHYGLPLLCHTGWEQALPVLNRSAADPFHLAEPLRRGLTVIASHCATRSMPWEIDFLPRFIRLVNEYERLYGDTAALNLPTRWYAYRAILDDHRVRGRLVHGSDWPIMPLPPPGLLGASQALGLSRQRNWLRRDLIIKKRLGLDEAYWHRAGQVVRLPGHYQARAPEATPYFPSRQDHSP